jgi:diaminopimelate epimerase
MAYKIIPFIKYSATGNDFIVVDNRRKALAGKQAVLFARLVCDRTTGAGADGVLLMEESRRADFRMRIINADGSEAEMCGNGSRAIAHFARSSFRMKRTMVFETIAGLIHGRIMARDVVSVRLTKPSALKKDIRIKRGSKIWKGHFINTGVPHFVVFAAGDLETVDVFREGRFIRNHPYFQPAGTNVNFVKAGSGNLIHVRTYERGVENETMACGTGSTASAIVSSLVRGLVPPIKVRTRSGETLRVHFKVERGTADHVFLEGRVRPVFSGRVRFNGKQIMA